jgi:hypothetical protein
MAFIDAFDHQRLLNVAGVQREHSLYGPQATRLAWIYPPFHHFLVKPQALLMPEVFIDDQNAPDTSTTSTDAVDGDVSNDSIGGRVVSQWRDIFSTRDRREVDLVVAKKLNNGPQLPLLVVEIKRDILTRRSAMDQIEDYLDRIVSRCAALGYNHPVYGLLVFGPLSIRIISTLNSRRNPIHTYIDKNASGGVEFVDTDSKVVNEWLLQQSLAFLNYQ